MIFRYLLEKNPLIFLSPQLLDKLLEACGYLGSYSDACQLTVLDNLDLISRGVRGLRGEDVCHLSGMCSESEGVGNAPAVYSNQEDVQCEFCEKVRRPGQWEQIGGYFTT